MTLKNQLFGTGPIVKLAGAHNAMGARLVREAGFAGVWASSFEIATAEGVPDADVLTWQQLHSVAAAMTASVALPVVADCQTGFGGPEILAEVVQAYEAAGIAAICVEDGACPHRNSLLSGQHPLAPREEFARKIKAAVTSRQHLLVLARLQSLIAGRSQWEAKERAHAYVDAGADAIVVHSRSPHPGEVLQFIAAWDRPTPLVLIPTTYHTVTEMQIAAIGKVRMMVYANHGLRAAIAGMKRVFRQILEEGTSHGAESWIAGLDDAFALQARVPGRAAS